MFRFSTGANVSRFAARAVLASGAIGVLPALCYTFPRNLPTTRLLLLLVVVIQATGGGFASSMLLSLLAAGILDDFLVPPVLTWRIADPFDLVALTTLVTVAVIITRLASRAREEACKAETRRKILERMYEARQRLLWLDPEGDFPKKLLGTLREVFGTRSVRLFDGETYLNDHDIDNTIAGLCIRCVRRNGKVTGAIGFEYLGDVEWPPAPLTALAIATLDRAQASRTATQADVAAYTK